MQKRETKTKQTHKRMDIETQTNEQKDKHKQKRQWNQQKKEGNKK